MHKERNEILPVVTTWMDLEDTMLSERSQAERQISHNFYYMWNLKNKRNRAERLINTEHRPVVSTGEQCGGRLN